MSDNMCEFMGSKESKDLGLTHLRDVQAQADLANANKKRIARTSISGYGVEQGEVSLDLRSQ